MDSKIFIMALEARQARDFARRRGIKDYIYVDGADRLRGVLRGKLYVLDGYFRHPYANEVYTIARERGLDIEWVGEDEG
jgi:hypothetical protein